MTKPALLPLHIASAQAGLAHVFIRDLVLEATIGVHRHEKRRRQPIRLNIDLTVSDSGKSVRDRLPDVVDYEKIVDGVRKLIAAGHVNLVETLAERIAAFCLEESRILAVRVRVEKLAAIADAASVGVEIERTRQS